MGIYTLAMSIKTYQGPETQLQDFLLALQLMSSVPFVPFPHQHNSELHNFQGQSTNDTHANPTQRSMRDPSLETAVSIL
jgi:hypothetical protein